MNKNIDKKNHINYENVILIYITKQGCDDTYSWMSKSGHKKKYLFYVEKKNIKVFNLHRMCGFRL